MKKIFLDTNVFIDIIQRRGEDTTSVRSIYKKFDKDHIFISSLTIHISFYVLKIKPNSETHKKISDLVNAIKIIPLDGTILSLSLTNYYLDFEDTLQYYSALEANCDYILTRDYKDLRKIKKNIPSKLEIITNLKRVK